MLSDVILCCVLCVSVCVCVPMHIDIYVWLYETVTRRNYCSEVRLRSKRYNLFDCEANDDLT